MTDVREDLTAEEFFGNKQADLQAAREQIAGPVPLIGQAPDCRVNLPRGLYVRGVHKKEAFVRELTGFDEEILAKNREAMDYYDALVALGTERVEDFDLANLPLAERQAHLRTLLIGERDQLYLAIIKATFGDRKTITFTCTACEKEQEMDLLLDEDFKPKVVDDVDQEIFTFTTSKGNKLEYRLVTGDDQREAFARKMTTAEQNSILLARCITRKDGGLIPDQMGFVRAMSIRDRQNLLTELVGRQPAIDLTVQTKCASCEAPITLPLGWGDLFRT